MNNIQQDLLKTIALALMPFLLLIMFVLLLSSTNPSREEFKQYMKKEFVQDSENQGFFSRLTTKIFASPAAWTIDELTDRYDYGLFSIYKTTLFDKEATYIGIFNNFHRIE